jgi:predicted transcriptional regulator
MNTHENILTVCEEVIMKAIWNADGDIATQDLIEVLRTQHGKDYARTTVTTFLIKLTAKRFVHTYRKGKNSYVHATINEEEYKDMILKHMIDFWYAGDVEGLQKKLDHMKGR